MPPSFLHFSGAICSNTLFSNTSALTKSLLFRANSTRKILEHLVWSNTSGFQFWGPLARTNFLSALCGPHIGGSGICTLPSFCLSCKNTVPRGSRDGFDGFGVSAVVAVSALTANPPKLNLPFRHLILYMREIGAICPFGVLFSPAWYCIIKLCWVKFGNFPFKTQCVFEATLPKSHFLRLCLCSTAFWTLLSQVTCLSRVVNLAKDDPQRYYKIPCPSFVFWKENLENIKDFLTLQTLKISVK